MWARVQNNIAVEVIDFNPSGRFHPTVEAQFIKVPDHVVQGASLVDGQWVNPTPQPPLTPEQLADAQAAQAAAAQQVAYEQQASVVRTDRDQRIAAEMWRYERIARQQRLNLPVIDDIAKLDNYIQALADISKQAGFPWNVTWPEQPA